MNEEPDHVSSSSRPKAEEEDSPFSLELVDRPFPLKKVWFWGAVLLSILGVWFIYEVTFTDVAKKWLPYTEETAQSLVPQSPDGQEPIELLELTHLSENEISIQGKLKNRTRQTIEESGGNCHGRVCGDGESHRKDVPVEPSKIGPGFEALFQLSQPVTNKPSGYSSSSSWPRGIVRRR